MSTNGSAGTKPEARGGGLLERLTELRMIIAILFAIYGIVCIIWGVAFTTPRDLERAAGINVNLVAGIGMLVFAALFALWALLKPLAQEIPSGEREPADDARG